MVQGQIDGKIVVKGKGVTVGKSGKVTADIHARSIRVEGRVRGDLYGEQARVQFVQFLRSEQRFEGIDALAEQLKHDIDNARKVLSQA